MKWPLSDWFSAARREPPPPRRRRPRLEVLEDRTVPAVLHVTNLASDSAATVGTLRYEVANSAANDTIVFDVAGTLRLTNGELVTTHALTIRGKGPSLDAIVGGSSRIFLDYAGCLALFGLTLTGSKLDAGMRRGRRERAADDRPLCRHRELRRGRAGGRRVRRIDHRRQHDLAQQRDRRVRRDLLQWGDSRHR